MMTSGTYRMPWSLAGSLDSATVQETISVEIHVDSDLSVCVRRLPGPS